MKSDSQQLVVPLNNPSFLAWCLVFKLDIVSVCPVGCSSPSHARFFVQGEYCHWTEDAYPGCSDRSQHGVFFLEHALSVVVLILFTFFYFSPLCITSDNESSWLVDPAHVAKHLDVEADFNKSPYGESLPSLLFSSFPSLLSEPLRCVSFFAF